MTQSVFFEKEINLKKTVLLTFIYSEQYLQAVMLFYQETDEKQLFSVGLSGNQ